jgi:hypothetical protein
VKDVKIKEAAELLKFCSKMSSYSSQLNNEIIDNQNMDKRQISYLCKQLRDFEEHLEKQKNNAEAVHRLF